MSRVLALGGCGGIGRHAVRTLLAEERVGTITIGDRDGERARAFADRCGERLSAVAVDVTDADALARVMARHDLVLNATGPYFRFGVPVLRAALEAGRDYVDACDDPQPTLEMLALDGLARERGCRAVVGMGITPGVSNLLAALAVAELERVRELVTGWDLGAALPEEIRAEPSAATLHGVEQLTGTIRLLRGGRFVDEPPIRTVRLDCPGLGVRSAWTIGHPEPVTLPIRYPELVECANVFTAPTGDVLALRALRWIVDRGWLRASRAASLAERWEGAGGHTPRLAEIVAEARRRGRMELPPLFALARGERRGGAASAMVTPSSAPAGGIGGTTGVPLAVGAMSLIHGEVNAPGVQAPESAFDPRRFLDRLAPLCDPPRASVEELTVVLRSWEDRELLGALAERLAADAQPRS